MHHTPISAWLEVLTHWEESQVTPDNEKERYEGLILKLKQESDALVLSLQKKYHMHTEGKLDQELSKLVANVETSPRNEILDGLLLCKHLAIRDMLITTREKEKKPEIDFIQAYKANTRFTKFVFFIIMGVQILSLLHVWFAGSR